MEIIIGLLIIAVGAFCQSSSYVPINKIRGWSWESYWIVQGVFAWLVLPFLGALLAVPQGHCLCELFSPENSFNVAMTVLFGVLWGVGGLTFGLSMRYLGVALGQSIALGTCAGLGTILGPVFLNVFFPEQDPLSKLTMAVIIGVVVTLVGIAVIGVAGSMKSASLSEEEKKAAVKDFNFPKGLAIALLAIPSALLTDTLTISQRLIGAVCVSIPFFLIGEISGAVMKRRTGEKIRGIELGDTLLMAASGLLIGPKAVAVAALIGIFLAAACGLAYKRITGESKFAFGPFLSMGLVIGTLFGNEIVAWYINHLILE